MAEFRFGGSTGLEKNHHADFMQGSGKADDEQHKRADFYFSPLALPVTSAQKCKPIGNRRVFDILPQSSGVTKEPLEILEQHRDRDDQCHQQ
ncbi:MAG: hypothetical protein FJY56_05990 [Betaproteobacteria bacterium]|nr:hypothetical protein [Betaproteobacteria bacterium]